jgi:predicted small metal-binding protein
MTLTITAACLMRGCGWAAAAGDWAEVDRQAERHAKTHPVAVTAVPA